jgi:hypothetical protein
MKQDKNSSTPYYLLAKAERLAGEHVHPAWRGQVGNAHATRAKQMVLKWLDSHLAICAELSTALAAQSLKLPVPLPAIVIASREDLPGLPNSAMGDQIILIGSEYKEPETFFTQGMNNNPAAEEFVWNKLCASSTAASGAAWDELIANDDRHFQNALFDGQNWWLFDHDRALQNSGSFCKNPDDQQTRLDLIGFKAKCNLLAEKTVERHQHNHGIEIHPIAFEKHKASLALLTSTVKNWSHPEPRINAIYSTTAILLAAIELRLPALAQHIQTRIARPNAKELTWD